MQIKSLICNFPLSFTDLHTSASTIIHIIHNSPCLTKPSILYILNQKTTLKDTFQPATMTDHEKAALKRAKAKEKVKDPDSYTKVDKGIENDNSTNPEVSGGYVKPSGPTWAGMYVVARLQGYTETRKAINVNNGHGGVSYEPHDNHLPEVAGEYSIARLGMLITRLLREPY